MCRQDTKAVPTALTGALGSKNTNYNSRWRQHEMRYLERDRVPNCGVGALYPEDNERGRILSVVVGPVNSDCKLPCSDDYRDKRRVLKLMVGTASPTIHAIHRVTSYLRLLAFSAIMSFLAWLLSDNSRSLEQIELRTLFLQLPKISAGVWVLVHVYTCA